MGDHALSEKRVKRLYLFVFWQMAGDLHRAHKETRIKQMQDRMFDAANILIHIHPVIQITQIGGGVGTR